MSKSAFFVLLFSAALYISCSSEQANDTNGHTDNESVTASAGPIDPVCDMVKDETWTEMVVEQSDTTWFCSETCKTAYLANPVKYKK